MNATLENTRQFRKIHKNLMALKTSTRNSLTSGTNIAINKTNIWINEILIHRLTCFKHTSTHVIFVRCCIDRCGVDMYFASIFVYMNVGV